jgi:hypothetical protein
MYVYHVVPLLLLFCVCVCVTSFNWNETSYVVCVPLGEVEKRRESDYYSLLPVNVGLKKKKKNFSFSLV